MKKIFVLAIAAVAAALVVPTAQSSRAGSAEDGLLVQLQLPVEFGSFDGCPEGVMYGLTADKFAGTGTTCVLKDVDFSPCNEGLGFCHDLPTHSILNLNPRGTIEFDANQHEVITHYDPATGAITFQITWTGTVSNATRKYHKLVGEPVSGGGSTSFDAAGDQTGDLAFLIGEADDSD
jgi:hypothetical protein